VRDIKSGRDFFHSSMGIAWLEYDLHLIDQIGSDAADFFEKTPCSRNPDLVLISNEAWFPQGEELATKIRSHAKLSKLPVYCVTSCCKKATILAPDCFNEEWRVKTGCDDDYDKASRSFRLNLDSKHPARIDGTICGNNVWVELPQIINGMTEFWFHSNL
jgi:hypothetical protein